MASDYVPDRLYARLFQPWTLPKEEWPLCREDWARVDAICALPWEGRLVDFGAGDGTLAAMVQSRNPEVTGILCVEQDAEQRIKIRGMWGYHGWNLEAVDALGIHKPQIDGALCCEVLEHMTPEQGHQVLCDLKRVMKPGAMLCVTVPVVGSSRSNYPGHVRGFDLNTLRDAVVTAGFAPDQVAHMTSYDYLPWIMCVSHA